MKINMLKNESWVGVGEWDNVSPKTNKVRHFVSLCILKTVNLLMGNLANSEDLNEMPH